MHTKLFSTVALFSALLFSTAVSGAPLNNLDFLKQLSTGTHQFEADGETFDAHVDNDGTNGWLLVGRGRNGWAFSNTTQGTTASVSQNLGTVSGFAPAHYSSNIINDLITNSANGIDLTNVEIRLKRAANVAGSTYSETLWRPDSQSTWRWDFDNQYAVDQEVVATGGVAGANIGVNTNANTRDTSISGNDGDRVFTWSWNGHGGQQGFSYGQAVQGVDGNDPNTFLWEIGTEAHAMPYTEVYIRNMNEPDDPLPTNEVPEPASIAIWSILGICLAGYGYRRRRNK